MATEGLWDKNAMHQKVTIADWLMIAIYLISFVSFIYFEFHEPPE